MKIKVENDFDRKLTSFMFQELAGLLHVKHEIQHFQWMNFDRQTNIASSKAAI